MIKNNVRKVVLVLRLKIEISKGVDVALNGRYRAFYEERNETALCNPAMKMEMLLIKFSWTLLVEVPVGKSDDNVHNTTCSHTVFHSTYRNILNELLKLKLEHASF